LVTRTLNSSSTVISTSDMWTDDDGRVVARVIDNSCWAYTYVNLGRTTGEYQPDPDNAMPWGMTSYTDTGIARPYTSFTYDANFNKLLTCCGENG
jgi:hypothetical protein